MARRKATYDAGNGTTANLGFEETLWAAADALRANMDAAEYKHVVLGLIFLKYISDAFEAKHAELELQRSEGADPEDSDEYRAAGIFWVPPEARWSHLQANAPQPTIGMLVDDAMTAIECDNPTLKSVLPKDYARPGLTPERLGQVINLVSDIGLGSAADRARDTLGRVYEYFLQRFASAEGKSGGQFYTPAHVVRVLVEMLAPYKGRVYDPCCGSGGMFVQSEKFIQAHAGRIGDISIYGQESNYTTWRLAKMNLAIRGIEAQIAHGDSFHNDRHPDLKADSCPRQLHLFNDSDWRGDLARTTSVGLRRPRRRQRQLLGCSTSSTIWPHRPSRLRLRQWPSCPPSSRAKGRSAAGWWRPTRWTAWLLSPASCSTPPRYPSVFGSSSAGKHNGPLPQPAGETLFIDARKPGRMVDRTHRELAEEDIARIAGTYHAWRGDEGAAEYRHSRVLLQRHHRRDRRPPLYPHPGRYGRRGGGGRRP